MKPAICIAIFACANATAEPLPLWEVGAFAASAVTPAYPAASERSRRHAVLPFVLYRGPILRADQNGVGARLWRHGPFDADIGFSLSLPAKSRDIDARAGLPDLPSLIEAGPRLNWRFAPQWRLELPLRAVFGIDHGLRRVGTMLEPRLVFEHDDPDGRWSISTQFGVGIADRKLQQLYYDVTQAYRADSGLLFTRLGTTGWVRLGEDWRLFGLVRVDSSAGAANRASPLFRQKGGVWAGVGLAWTWRRSAARASQ